MIQHYVYAMVDPDTDRVEYVGCTHNLSSRIQQHACNGTCGGKTPVVKIIGTGTRDECLDLERRAILIFQAVGQSMRNRQEMNYELVHPTKRVQRDLLKTGEVALLMGVNRKTIQLWVRARRLTPDETSNAGYHKFSKQTVNSFAAEIGVKPRWSKVEAKGRRAK